MADFLLHELAADGEWKQMEVLFRINNVKDIDLRDDDFEGQTALHWAVRRGNVRCCEILLEHGANSSLEMFQGWTPAHCAAEIGNLEIMKLLAQYSADFISTDIFGATPKDIAELYDQRDCIEYLEGVESDSLQRKHSMKDCSHNTDKIPLLSRDSNSLQRKYSMKDCSHNAGKMSHLSKENYSSQRKQAIMDSSHNIGIILLSREKNNPV